MVTSLDSKRKMFLSVSPTIVNWGEVVHPLMIIKVTHLHGKIFRGFREVEKKKIKIIR